MTNESKKKNNIWVIVSVIGLIGFLCVLMCAFVVMINYLDSSRNYSSPSSNNNPTSKPEPTYDFRTAIDFVKIVTDKESDFDCSRDSIGNMIITGKVRNTNSEQNLKYVELRGIIKTSENGQILNTNTSYIDSDILYANSYSTFKIYVDDPNEEGRYCSVEIIDAEFE